MIFQFNMVINAAFSAWRLFWAKLAGFRVLASEEEVEERLNTCDGCEALTEGRQCADCGCLVDAKVRLAPEECPRKYWFRILEKKSVKSR